MLSDEITDEISEEISLSVGASASGKIAEIWLSLSQRVGDVSLLQAARPVSGVKTAANVAVNNNILFFIFLSS